MSCSRHSKRWIAVTGESTYLISCPSTFKTKPRHHRTKRLKRSRQRAFKIRIRCNPQGCVQCCSVHENCSSFDIHGLEHALINQLLECRFGGLEALVLARPLRWIAEYRRSVEQH